MPGVTLLIAVILCYKFGLPWPWWVAAFVVYGFHWWVRLRHYNASK